MRRHHDYDKKAGKLITDDPIFNMLSIVSFFFD